MGMGRRRAPSRSCRDREARLQTCETGVDQRRYPGPHDNVGLAVSHVLNSPLDDATAALRLDFEQARVMGHRKSGDPAVPIQPLRIVDCFETFDDFATVARL